MGGVAGGQPEVGGAVTGEKASAGAAAPRDARRSCTGCGQPLSRYNPQNICAACAGAGRDSAPGGAAVDVSAVDSVQDPPVTLTVSKVDLIELNRDAHVYEWVTTAEVPFLKA